MADKNLLSQMLESLVNDEQAKAEELFHEYVVAKSREIYETLIESEIDDDEEVEEGSEEDKDEDEKVEEAFGDEGGDDEFGGDATDDLEGDVDADADEVGADDEFGGEAESEDEIMQDLGDIIDELQAKFDALSGAEEEQGEFGDEGEDEFGAADEFGSEEEPEEGFDLATVREYVEKVPAGHGAEKKGAAEKADNNGLKFSKNDMGGTSANILSGRNGAEANLANQGELKGSGLLKGKTQEENFGNVNVPGGNAGKTGFKKKEPGHGAEKKGAAEGSTEAQSLFRGRR